MRSQLENASFTGDVPLPRFGHSITFYSQSKLCLFGGAIGSPSAMSMTQLAYSLDMETRQWSKIQCTGSTPSGRAAHGAACVGKNTMVIYGGATRQGLASDQLYHLNIKQGVGIWNIVNVRHKTPGKRYGHTLIFSCGYLIVFGGNLQNQTVNDLWIIDITKKPQWCEVKCKGSIPKPRDYHSAALCSTQPAEGMMIIFGGRSNQKQPLNDCWGLVRHNSTGIWEWKQAPNKNKAKLCARYQHTSLFIQNLMFVIGGKNNSNQRVPTQIFDIETNEWSSFPTPARLRHASWFFDKTLFNFGGLCENQFNPDEIEQINLQSLLFKNQQQMANNLLKQSTVSNKSSNSNQSTRMISSVRSASTQRLRQSPVFKKQHSVTITGRPSMTRMLESTKSNQKIKILNPIYGNQNKKQQIKKPLQIRQNVGMLFLNKLMHPKLYSTNPLNVNFSAEQIIALCDLAEQIIANQPMLLNVRAPLKIFGDIHGQFSDLMEFFKLYGTPHSNNQKQKSDIENFDYVFLGDYVDRGNHSLETICLLLALKVVYPNQVHLLRGNHQDMAINRDHGFEEECALKMDQETDSPNSVYMRINRVFEWLPLAALAQDKILCLHGGIGKGLNSLSQIQQIKRPLEILHEAVDKQSQIVLDIMWSDPTESDDVLGIHPNTARDFREEGNIVRFGPDRVHSFLKNNDLSMIVRAHEYVMDGFERFAGGALITLFSATDYCKRHKNAGAILILKTNLEIIPKVIYPKQKSATTWIGEDDNYTVKRSETPPRWRTFN